MLRYLFRAKPGTESKLTERIVIEKPYVAMHVRRGDKNQEYPFQPIEDYMKHVEEFFEQIEIKNGRKLEEKRVYMASDETNMLDECQQKFPG